MLIGPLSHFRSATWLTLVFLGSLLFRDRTQATDPKVAYACSQGVTGRECIIFNLSCNSDQRIQLMSADYSFGRKHHTKSLNGQMNQVLAENISNCVGNSIYSCNGKGGSECCAARQNDPLDPYSPTNYYELFNKCSWQQRCNPQAASVNASSDYCVVKYKCAQEHNVTFCDVSEATGSTLNIIYKGSNLTYSNIAERSCWCDIKSKDNFTIKAQDFRFLHDNGTCIDSMKLTGFLPNETINCSNSEVQQLINLEMVSGNSKLELSLPQNTNPQMVWIIAEGNGNASITAKCFDMNEQPSAGSFSTSLSMTGNTTPNISLDTTTEHQGIPHGSTTTALSNHSQVLEVHATSSGEVPIVAIVCPVIIVLIGAGIGIVIWRKRRKKKDKSDGPGDVKTDKPENDTNKIKYNDFDNSVPLNTLIKTSDNYIVLESENTYTYIDHEDVQNKAATNNERSKTTGLPPQARQSYNPSYFILEPQNFSSSSEEGNKTVPCKTDNAVKTIEAMGEKHTYFVLEAHSPLDKDSLSTVEQSSNLDKATPPNALDTESHNYFVLEPQNTSGANSQPHKTNDVDNNDVSQTETTGNHNYFVLEPQNTYSSIDPNDKNVQTLPDDEYNVLHVKSEGLSLDPNYDALKGGQHRNDINDTDDYSHLQNAPVGKQPVKDYSHVNVGK